MSSFPSFLPGKKRSWVRQELQMAKLPWKEQLDLGWESWGGCLSAIGGGQTGRRYDATCLIREAVGKDARGVVGL